MTALQAMFLGDSVAYGSMGTGRLTTTPRMNINANQTVFNIPPNLDFTKGGASTAGWLSDDPVVREANGLPGGATLDFLMAFGGCDAVLFCAGGNDAAAGYMQRIRTLAGKCQTHGKIFAFVGLIDIDPIASYDYAIANGTLPPTTGYYDSTYPEHVASLAYNAELLRQVCRREGYPYIDTRTVVPAPWGAMTGDLVHPNQAYSTAIFTAVADAIS